MKRTVLLGGLAALAVGTLAMAQMLPPTDDTTSPSPAIVPAPAAQGILTAPLDAREQDREVLAEIEAAMIEARRKGDKQDLQELQELKDLMEQQAAMSDAERKAEEDFMSLKLGPEVDVSGVERVPSAAENQPYRTCEKTPEMRANLRSLGDSGNRAYRDIAGYLSVTNVIATKDCTCAGKIIPHQAVAMFKDELRKRLGVTTLKPDHTRDLYKEYDRQLKVIAAMCGEY